MSATDTAVSIIKGILPFIGTALGGPLGGGAAAFIASKLGVEPEAVTNTITSMLGNPEQVVKLKALELEYQEHCQAMGYNSIKDLETINASVLLEVNKTMQAEAASEHWPTYTWRPFVGFVFGIMIFGCYFILPLLHIPTPTVPSEAWIAMGGVLGVASFFRGKMQADPTIPTNNKG